MRDFPDVTDVVFVRVGRRVERGIDDKIEGLERLEALQKIRRGFWIDLGVFLGYARFRRCCQCRRGGLVRRWAGWAIRRRPRGRKIHRQSWPVFPQTRPNEIHARYSPAGLAHQTPGTGRQLTIVLPHPRQQHRTALGAVPTAQPIHRYPASPQPRDRCWVKLGRVPQAEGHEPQRRADRG